MSLNPKLLSSCLSVGREIITPARVKDAAEWAEKYRVLSEFERHPRTLEQLGHTLRRATDAGLEQPWNRQRHLMCCSQASKSEIVRNALGFWITAAPGPTLWVMPSVAAAEEAVDERLGPDDPRTQSLGASRRSLRHQHEEGIKLTSMRIYPATQGSPQALATRPAAT